MSEAISIGMVAKPTPLALKAADLLRREVEERTGLHVVAADPRDASVRLEVKCDIGAEGFRIEDGPNGCVRVIGNDERGLLYGVGKFLRSSQCRAGAFTPGSWRGTSVPEKDVRGMYFATHFHNWYHEAPVADIVRYVEELALWGCNALSVWFDMHHFTGIDDPAAQAMIERLRVLLKAANAVGIGAALTTLANEAYATSPEELRADWTDGHDGYFRPPGGHYHVEVCPSKPGGLDVILEYREQMLEAFSDIDVRYFWIWPYDQGGCTCSDCAPWGINGLLTVAEPVAALARKVFPDTKIILSTWYFDHFIAGEWDGLSAMFAEQTPDWIDYLLVDDHLDFPQYPLEHGVPGGLPAVNFAEISMAGMGPWGGFGANPRPRHWQEYWNKSGHLVSGGFPYSEGIYEDLNKVITLQLNWAPDRTTEDIVHEYAQGCFSHEIADEFVRAALMLEEDHGTRARLENDALEYVNNGLPRAEACFELMQQLDARLPGAVQSSWRWRLLWLRAALDAEVKRTGGAPSAATDAYLSEIGGIYHAHCAERPVRPPSRPAMSALVGREIR